MKTSDLVFSGRAQNNIVFFNKPLFVDKNLTPIYKGDEVTFKQGGSSMVSSGYINVKGGVIKLDCFSTLLNRWRTYTIEE